MHILRSSDKKWTSAEARFQSMVVCGTFFFALRLSVREGSVGSAS